jgi:hypothetical protein
MYANLTAVNRGRPFRYHRNKVTHSNAWSQLNRRRYQLQGHQIKKEYVFPFGMSQVLRGSVRKCWRMTGVTLHLSTCTHMHTSRNLLQHYSHAG